VGERITTTRALEALEYLAYDADGPNGHSAVDDLRAFIADVIEREAKEAREKASTEALVSMRFASECL